MDSSKKVPVSANTKAGISKKKKGSSSDKDGGGSSSGDWRKSVPQSYRSEEVRNISKVLASLEPGTTASSKLMLAMKFEQSIFSSASSLVDYRKRLLKRLKRLQKNYIPPDTSEQKTDDEVWKRRLRDQYGKDLRYIIKHSAAAVRMMTEVHGTDRAVHLKRHLDNAAQWSVDIGLPFPNNNSNIQPRPQEPDYLTRIEGHLQQRVDNIRSHVVKMIEPDTFLAETMDKLRHQELLLTKTTNKEEATSLLNALADCVQRQLQVEMPNINEEWVKRQVPLLNNRMTKIVPASTKEACCIHLEKLRAAVQSMVVYLALPLDQKLYQHSSIMKAHAVAVESLEYLCKNYPSLSSNYNQTTPTTTNINQDNNKGSSFQIKHLWERAMEYPMDQDSNINNSSLLLPKLALKSRVLLVGNRKPPTHLIPALRRKNAHVIMKQESPQSEGYFIISLTIDKLLEFQLRFTPLLVTLQLSDDNNNNLSTIYAQELQYASAKATYVLRRCFGEKMASIHQTTTHNDFETEISEATALLKFLDLARASYTPNWNVDKSAVNPINRTNES